MGDLKRLKTQADRMLGTVALAAAGLAIATDTTQAQNANAVPHTIDGKFMTDLSATDGLIDLSTAEGAETLNADNSAPAKALILLTVDTAGTVKAYQSEIVNPNGDPAYASKDGKLHWPQVPVNEAAFGGIEIVTDSSTSFVPGTTALNAAGITTTYVDMAHVPAERR